MLRILLSRDWIACRNEILNRIRDDVAQQLPGRILLVPELISHDMERRLCKTAGVTASRFAEVLSFPRLASRVSDRVGNAAMQCLDNGGRIVAMAAATNVVPMPEKSSNCCAWSYTVKFASFTALCNIWSI